jgi:hypothetical protein
MRSGIPQEAVLDAAPEPLSLGLSLRRLRVMASADEGHVFISYVREDAERVDRLQRILEAAGVKVWRDTSDLWPGEDWRARIRNAITRNALVFVACFSNASEGKQVSGQNDELVLAVDQLRLRRPDTPWLVPVRFDDVEVPDLDLGAGRTLNSIQRADLIGDTWDHGAAKLVAAVLRALGKPVEVTSLPAPTATLEAQLKAALRDPMGDVALNDLLIPIANEVRESILSDDEFPRSSDALGGPVPDAALYLMGLVDSYLEILNPALDALVITAQWALGNQMRTVTRFIERLASTSAGGTGMVVLLDLRWFPVVVVEYTGAIAALHQRNYGALKSIVIDAEVRDLQDGKLPLVGRGNPWRPFSRFELLAQLLALRASGEEVTRELAERLHSGQRGKRYTPVSDYLHDTLRPKFRGEVPNDDDYADLFDVAEVFLALLAIDANSQRSNDRVYLDRPNFGRITWRDRYSRPEERLEARLLRELERDGSKWPPLEAGLFGGSRERATAALESFISEADEARTRRF